MASLSLCQRILIKSFNTPLNLSLTNNFYNQSRRNVASINTYKKLLHPSTQSPRLADNNGPFDVLGSKKLSPIHQINPSRTFAMEVSLTRKNIFNFLTMGRNPHEMERAALAILNGIYMKAPQKELRVHAALEDSFAMWFTMVMVHIWLVGARLGREGKDGKKIFELMLTMMWEDVEERLKKFEGVLKKNLKIKKRLKNYYREVNLSFHLLDEGVTGSDADLASSLWSILKMKDQVQIQAWHLEVLVHYVRYWSNELDDISMEQILANPEKVIFSFPEEILNVES